MSRSRKKRYAKNHQSSWLYGRHAVLAMLAGHHWRAETLFVVDSSQDSELEIPPDMPVESVSAERLAELTKTQEHQGLAARMPPYPYAKLEDLLADLPERILILDRIQYPMNFGTMLRSAEVFGVTNVIVADSGQSDVTASVARMSAGAVFGSRIAQVEDLAATVPLLQNAGFTVFATTPEQGKPCHEVDLSGRTAIVIGRESDGVSRDVLAACDDRILIPQEGETQSLNAAASAAIILYEMSRQRGFRVD